MWNNGLCAFVFISADGVLTMVEFLCFFGTSARLSLFHKWKLSTIDQQVALFFFVVWLCAHICITATFFWLGFPKRREFYLSLNSVPPFEDSSSINSSSSSSDSPDDRNWPPTGSRRGMPRQGGQRPLLVSLETI